MLGLSRDYPMMWMKSHFELQ